MIDYGYWFYHELQDKVGVRPACHRGDKEDSYLWLETPTASYRTKVSSYRLELFRQNPQCVVCKRVGSLWILQAHRKNEPPHLNLYYVGDGEVEGHKKLSKDGLVMMTKDHIIPKSAGGPTTLENLQTMCAICNGKKGDSINDLCAWEKCTTKKWEMSNLNGLPHFK